MDRFRKFCEKPLFIISLCMTFIFTIALVIMMAIPHGKIYYFNYTIEDTNHYYEITLDEKYSEKHYYVLDGESYDVEDMLDGEYEFEIDNGELYILDGGSTNQRQKVGEVNSRKIYLNRCVLGMEDHDTVLVCRVNTTLTNIFTMLLSLGIFLLVISIVMKYAHSHHDKKLSYTNDNDSLKAIKAHKEMQKEGFIDEDEDNEPNFDVDNEDKDDKTED